MSSYICAIKEHIHKRDPDFKQLRKVDRAHSCPDLITRPKFGAETYGYPVILYRPQEEGVMNFSLREDEKKEYEDRIQKIKDKYGILNFKPSLGFGWSWTSIKWYSLKRNRKLHNLKETGKYKCDECGRLFYGDDVESHHIMETTQGGSHTTANIRVLCLYCHAIETWKYITKREIVPDWVKWKKAVEIKKRIWEEKWKYNQHWWDIQVIKRDMEYLNSFTPEKIAEFESEGKLKVSPEDFSKRIGKRLKICEDKLEKINQLTASIQRRLKFWRYQHKIVSKWDDDIEELHKRLKQPNKLINL